MKKVVITDVSVDPSVTRDLELFSSTPGRSEFRSIHKAFVEENTRAILTRRETDGAKPHRTFKAVVSIPTMAVTGMADNGIQTGPRKDVVDVISVEQKVHSTSPGIRAYQLRLALLTLLQDTQVAAAMDTGKDISVVLTG